MGLGRGDDIPCLHPGRNPHGWSDTHVRSQDGHRDEKGGRKEKKKKGERGRNERVLVQFVDRA